MRNHTPVFPGGGGGSTENRHRLSDTHTQPAGALLSRSAQSKPGIAVYPSLSRSIWFSIARLMNPLTLSPRLSAWALSSSISWDFAQRAKCAKTASERCVIFHLVERCAMCYDCKCQGARRKRTGYRKGNPAPDRIATGRASHEIQSAKNHAPGVGAVQKRRADLCGVSASFAAVCQGRARRFSAAL